MYKRLLSFAALAVTIVLAAQASDKNARRCSGSSKPDVQIAACTALIQSGRETNEIVEAAFYNRGNAYAQKAQYDLALQDYDQALRLNPNDEDVFYSRGFLYLDRLRDYDRAVQDYDQVLRLNPRRPQAFVGRGLAYAGKRQYDRAIQDYDQALRLNPNDDQALLWRGEAKKLKGDTAGGDADLARARQLNSQGKR